MRYTPSRPGMFTTVVAALFAYGLMATGAQAQSASPIANFCSGRSGGGSQLDSCGMPITHPVGRSRNYKVCYSERAASPGYIWTLAGFQLAESRRYGGHESLGVRGRKLQLFQRGYRVYLQGAGSNQPFTDLTQNLPSANRHDLQGDERQ